MKKYLSLINYGVKSQLINRGVILAKFSGFIVQFIVMYFLWKAIYGENYVINNRTFEEMIIYISLSIIISALYIYPNIYFISEDIKSGNIINILLKPLDFQLHVIFKTIGIFLFMAVLLLIIFIPFSIIFKQYINGNMIYFIISIAFGFMTVISFDFMLSMICFWTENSWGLMYFQSLTIQLFSGALIPLDYFSGWFKIIVMDYLPFQGIVYRPIEYFTFEKEFEYFFRNSMVQILWIGIFILLGRILFNRAKKGVMINGG